MSKRPSIVGSLNIGKGEPAVPEPALSSPPLPEKTKRNDIVHTSVYVPKPAYRKLREIAFTKEIKIHDLIMDGIDAVLQQNGHPPMVKEFRSAKTS
jgi:hypothetical protein